MQFLSLRHSANKWNWNGLLPIASIRCCIISFWFDVIVRFCFENKQFHPKFIGHVIQWLDSSSFPFFFFFVQPILNIERCEQKRKKKSKRIVHNKIFWTRTCCAHVHWRRIDTRCNKRKCNFTRTRATTDSSLYIEALQPRTLCRLPERTNDINPMRI